MRKEHLSWFPKEDEKFYTITQNFAVHFCKMSEMSCPDKMRTTSSGNIFRKRSDAEEVKRRLMRVVKEFHEVKNLTKGAL